MLNDQEWYRNQNQSNHRFISKKKKKKKKNTAKIRAWESDLEQPCPQIV
jgi:hypothetical protein